MWWRLGRAGNTSLERAVRWVFLLGFLALAPMGRGASKHARRDGAGTSFFLYAGTFTGAAPNGHPDGHPPSKGIYRSRFDAATGALSAPELVADVANPSFMAVSPNQRYLYAVTESGPESFVSAYAIDPHTGTLRLLNRLPTGGSGTAYLSLDRTGRSVLLANYGSASVTVLRVRSDGSLGNLSSFVQHAAPRGSNAARGAVPHPHATAASPDNHFVVVPDLGLNMLFVYRFDAANGVLALPARTVELSPDDGPRHFVFSPDGRFGYLVGQTRGTVDVFRWDASEGTLSPVGTATSFPAGLDAANMSAEIGITPNGKFLYESNRRTHGATHELGPDSLMGYRVDAEAGSLTQVQSVDLGASIPRCFSIDPTGAYMVVSGQQTDRLNVYRIDGQSGLLSNSGVSVELHAPACMQFARAR